MRQQVWRYIYSCYNSMDIQRLSQNYTKH